MLALFEYDFFQNALIVGFLASLLCGFIGTFIVVKRLVFISGGISHAAFGGLGFCHWACLQPIYGALFTSVITAIILSLAQIKKIQHNDTLIGILWALGIAIGIIFIHQTPGYSPDLMSYLFGNILMISNGEVYTILGLSSLTLMILLLFFKEFVAITFDEEFASLQDIWFGYLNTLLFILTAITIVVLIQAAGIILVLAWLTIPTAIALELHKNIKPAIITSIGVCLTITYAGIALSYLLDLPSGPIIILVGTSLYLILLLIKRIVIKGLPQKTLENF